MGRAQRAGEGALRDPLSHLVYPAARRWDRVEEGLCLREWSSRGCPGQAGRALVAELGACRSLGTQSSHLCILSMLPLAADCPRPVPFCATALAARSLPVWRVLDW